MEARLTLIGITPQANLEANFAKGLPNTVRAECSAVLINKETGLTGCSQQCIPPPGILGEFLLC